MPARDRPAEVFHPSVFIQEEMDARGWSRDDLALRMGGDFATDRLALEVYFILQHKRSMRIGDKFARQLARAFDVSPEFFLNLERIWLEANK